VIGLTGVTLGDDAGDVLAAAQRCEKRGKIIADAGVAGKHFRRIGKIRSNLTGCNLIGKRLVELVARGDELIESDDLGFVGGESLAEGAGFGTDGICGGEGDFCGADQIRGHFIVQRDIYRGACIGGIRGSADVVVDCDGVGSIAVFECVGARCAVCVVVIPGNGVMGDADFNGGGEAGLIVDGEIALRGGAGVDGFEGSGIYRGEDGRDGQSDEQKDTDEADRAFHGDFSFR